MIDSSASGCTCCAWSTKRAIDASLASSTSTPDSLATSIDTSAPGAATRPERVVVTVVTVVRVPVVGVPVVRVTTVVGVLALGVVPLVRVDDVAHQLVPDDVDRVQLGEMDVVDTLEDPAYDAQAGRRVARQVDLRDVARDHDLRAEAETGEEHLHLLGRR